MKGLGNHLTLGANADFVAEGILQDFAMYSVSDYFPAIVKKPGFRVHGELWQIDDVAFLRCDHLEGYPSHYDREQVKVTSVKHTPSKVYTAWVYFYRHPEYLSDNKFIPSGSWRTHKSGLPFS